MKRLEHWPQLLAQHLELVAGKPGAWGERDCAIAFCDAVLAMTGEDLAAEFRGKYSTELGAGRMLKKLGVANMEELADQVFAAHDVRELPKVLFAQRGDAVIIDTEKGPAMGIVGLDGMHAVTVSLEGSVKVPIVHCRRAWRI